MKTNLLCIPQLKPTTCATKTTKRFVPVTLLERFREAVFRLIMLSTLSNKATTRTGPSGSKVHQRSYHRREDPHRSEAMADCIEFIKKKASPDQSRDSTASSTIDAIAISEAVSPVSLL